MEEIITFRTEPATYNKDLVESYDFATMREGMGICGQRLLLRLVEAANATGILKGIHFAEDKDGCQPVSPARVETDLFGHTRIIMPMWAIMPGDSYEHSKVKADIRAAMNYIIETKDQDGSTIMFPFLTYAKFNEGEITIEVQDELWSTFLNFTKGFRVFEMKVALSLSKKHALKMYQLISGQTSELHFGLEELKKILGLKWHEMKKEGKQTVIIEKEKYSRPVDFIARVIKPCKKELDACSPYTFDYRLRKSKKCKAGRSAITGIDILPVYQPKFRDEHLQSVREAQRVTMFAEGDTEFLSKECKKMLLEKFDFTLRGIQNNLELLNEATRKLNLLALLDEIAKSAAKKRPLKPQGYVIRAIERALREKAGIDVSK